MATCYIDAHIAARATAYDIDARIAVNGLAHTRWQSRPISIARRLAIRTGYGFDR